MKKEKILTGLGIAFGVLVLAFTVSLLLALPVKWLWNWLCPELFGLKTISVLQAWGLSALTALLFKSYSANSKS